GAAQRLGAQFSSTRVCIEPGPNLEARARAARYTALEATRSRVGASVVLVAHTADDQAETVVLNLLRGSASAGLGGMAVRRGVAAARRQHAGPGAHPAAAGAGPTRRPDVGRAAAAHRGRGRARPRRRALRGGCHRGWRRAADLAARRSTSDFGHRAVAFLSWGRHSST